MAKVSAQILFTAAVLCGLRPLDAACEFDDSLWLEMKKAKRDKALAGTAVETLDSRCFAQYLRRLAENGAGDAAVDLMPKIERYTAARGPLNPSLFFAIRDALGESGRPAPAAAMLALWEKGRGKAPDALQNLERRGAYREMDSVYAMMSDAGALDVYSMLRWGSIRCVLKEWEGAAEVFCRVSILEPNLASMARAQMVQQLTDAGDDARAAALGAYYACCSAEAAADMMDLSRWLSDTYAYFGLYAQEVAAIMSSTPDRAAAGQRLLEVARRRFSRRLFRETIEPAQTAYGMLQQQPQRTECAALLYQSYLKSGRTDSAIAWFNKAALNDERSVSSAAALYQAAGLFPQADSLIGLLAPSISRDTLQFRQHIFKGQLTEAAALVGERTAMKHWRSFPLDASLWRLRTAVYAGDRAAAAGIIDSARIDPSWHGAREMLTQQYAVQVFTTAPEAYKGWGKLMRALFIGQPALVADTIAALQIYGPVRELMYVTLAEALIRAGMFARSLDVLSRLAEAEVTPRVMYYRAEALAMQGKTAEARSMLEELILKHPLDVFSQKARMYLLGFKAGMNM